MLLNRQVFGEIMFRSAISLLCCIMIGYMRYGMSIFSFYNHQFAVIALGVIGSVFFFSLVKLERQYAFLILFILFLINSLLLTKSFQHKVLFADLVSVGALAGAVYLYYHFVYLTPRASSFLNPIILGVLVGLFAFAATMIRVVFIRLPGAYSFDFTFILSILRGAAVEFFVGLGIGIGILVTNISLINKSLKFT